MSHAPSRSRLSAATAVVLTCLALMAPAHPALSLDLDAFNRIGGPARESVTAIIADRRGDFFITGTTRSAGLATPGAFQTIHAGSGATGGDAYVSKINGDTLRPIWTTYLGGRLSENGIDDSGGLAFGQNGTIIVAGTTASTDFPTTPDALQPTDPGTGEDLFVSILSADGSTLLYSTYLGGTSGDLLMAFARGPDGRLYLGGQTSSTDFPVTTNAALGTFPGGLNAGFLLRLTPDARAIDYGTYLGGTRSDRIKSIVVRGTDEIWLGGHTSSPDFPVTSDAFNRRFGGCSAAGCDLFLTRLNGEDGSLAYSSYFGGADSESFGDMIAFGLDTLYVTGDTGSADFPLTNWGVQPVDTNPDTPDGFVLRFNTITNTIAYSTLLGGERAGELMSAVAILQGGALIAGATASRDFPTTPDAHQDAFVTGSIFNGAIARVSADGRSQTYGSYLGGNGFDEVKLIARRVTGPVPTSGRTEFFIAGETRSSSLHPTDPGAFGSADIFLTRWSHVSIPVVTP